MKLQKFRKYIINFSSQFFANSFAQLITLFALPYAARVLGANKFGEYNLVASFAAYAGIISIFGFPIYASREVARTDNIKNLVNLTVTLKLLLSFLSFGIMILVGLFINASKDFFWLTVISGFLIIFSSFDLRWIFIAKDKLWKVSYTALLGTVIFAISLFFLVKSPDQIIIYSILITLPILVPTVHSLLLYIKEFDKLSFNLVYDNWNILIKESLPLGLSLVVAVLNTYFSAILIGLFLSINDLGYYFVGFKLILVSNTFFNLIATVIFPTISRLYSSNKKKLIRFMQISFYIFLISGVVSSILLIIFSNWIVDSLFGLEYEKAKILIRIWALGFVPLIPISIFFASSLVPCNGSKEYLKVSLISTVSTIIGVPIFVYFFNLKGVPIANSISQLVLTIAGAYFLTKKLQIRFIDFLKFDTEDA